MDEHISCILEYIHDLNTAARNQFTSRSTGLWWIWSGVQVLVKLWEIGYFDYEQIHCQCGIDHWFVKCFWILHYQFSILLWQISKNDFFLICSLFIFFHFIGVWTNFFRVTITVVVVVVIMSHANITTFHYNTLYKLLAACLKRHMRYL